MHIQYRFWIWNGGKKETRCCHYMGYSFRLAARDLLYASSHRQDGTYHGLCITSHGALAGTRNSSISGVNDCLIKKNLGGGWHTFIWGGGGQVKWGGGGVGAIGSNWGSWLPRPPPPPHSHATEFNWSTMRNQSTQNNMTKNTQNNFNNNNNNFFYNNITTNKKQHCNVHS